MRVEVADVLHLPLGDDEVDLVFTSPPYEDARTYGIGYKLRGEEWVRWAVPAFEECLRVCRGLVAWVVQGRTRGFRWSAVPALLMADLHRRGVMLRSPPIFQRFGVPGSGGPDWWRSDYEFIVCATKRGRLPWSDNVATGHPPKWGVGGEMSNRQVNGLRTNVRWGGKKGRTERLPDGTLKNRDYNPPEIANPGNVIKLAVGGGQMGSPLAHETEAPFPEALAEPFIRCFCPPGGTVLDPMCGSGTTLAVAQRFGREAIGFDIRASQVELTQRRLAQLGVGATVEPA